MKAEIKVPAVGESVQEGMISSWVKQEGDQVEVDDILLELETDKATVEVASEHAGVLHIEVAEGTVVKIGQVIGSIDTAASGATASPPATTVPAAEPAPSSVTAPDPGPAVRRMAAEENIDISQIPGSGRGGRVTKEDLVHRQPPTDPTPPPPPAAAAAPKSPAMPVASGGSARETTRKPTPMIRRRIAERLVHAQQSAAILTTFNEVDMSAILALRNQYKDAFAKKNGIKLGFMGFFLKASVAALEAFPAANSFFEGDEIAYHNYCDIGVAVSTGKGLVVPIIRDCDKLSLTEIEMAIGAYATKARENKIALTDLEGGTFTVSNGGVFGSLLSTPILNPPQTAILGMHKTQQRPVVDDAGNIVAKPMMYLALSYDHRLLDGKEAVGFLIKIKENLEDPTRLLLEV